MPDFTNDRIIDFLILIGRPLSTAAVYLIVGFWVARFAGRWVERKMARRSVGWNGTALLARLVSISIQVASVLLALIAVGASATGLLTVFGAFTVAIGLSLQDVFKNFFAGIYLLFEQPFRVGDRIAIRDVVGEVQGIDIRTTLVKNLDGELVMIPNALVFTEILQNNAHYGVRRLDLKVTTSSRGATEIDRLVRSELENIDEVRRPIPVARIVSSKPPDLTLVISLMLDDTDDAEMKVLELVVIILAHEAVDVMSS
ncbi:hypothetical protein BH20CHL2_BH20CHL2_06810 [soil metagenome]